MLSSGVQIVFFKERLLIEKNQYNKILKIATKSTNDENRITVEYVVKFEAYITTQTNSRNDYLTVLFFCAL